MMTLSLMRAILSQTFRGISTHLTAQLITVATISASLSILAATLTLAFNLDRISTQWERGGEVLVFLKSGASTETYKEAARQIESWPEIESTTLRTPQDAQRELMEALGEIDFTQTIDLEILPATLELKMSSPSAQGDQVEVRGRLLALSSVQEVESITEGRGLLARLYEVRDALKIWMWLIGAWITSSVAFVISQLVRLNLFHRRRELEILLAIGATERFVQLPLMIESAIQGALGASVALFIVNTILQGAIEGGGELLSLLQIAIDPIPFITQTYFILGSALISILSSWRATGRFLRLVR
jgi:cell division transport system permease protein